MNVAIVGGGNFGTAIANIIARNGYTTYLWMRDPEQVAQTIEAGENLRYLPGHPLEAGVKPTADLGEATKDARVVFVAVPSSGFASVCREMAPFITADDILISATKGIEPDGFRLMSQLLGDLTPSEHTGAISGPNLAEEIAEQQYAGTVIATHHHADATLVQEIMRNDTLRVYASADVYGVELGGALKNIYAIVCGLAAGLSVGQNTIGLLVTRALAEMSRFAVSMGGNPFTFLGLAGVGDLMVTCTSPLSRNHQLGNCIAKGLTLEEASESLGKLAEGVNTLRLVHGKSHELGVYMPLVDGLYEILFEERGVAEVIGTLMGSSEGADVEFVDPSRWQ